MCKDDREEEIAKFDGDTIRKDNLKATSEGFWLRGNKNRVTRMDEMRGKYRGAESCRVSSADLEENCPTLIDLPVQQIEEQRVEVQRVIHSQERLQQHSGVRCIKLFTGV